ncbi:MAG: hypothetical protein JOY71_27250 [Acetobacteraceae bacterium]|nr:hypothetical protein [Acetobacteraceae bacterium]MBV8525765.1 hypothetical protein [Acetobacteraceae bacterium]
MRLLRRMLLQGIALIAAIAGPAKAAAPRFDHVLLISIDGLHWIDMAN